MQILFVAPRYHTNQIDIVKTLQKNNHKVFFLTKSVGLIEDHKILKPHLMLKSIFSLILEKLFFFLKNKDIFYIVNYKFLKEYLIKNNIDIVVIRIHNRLNLYFISLVCLILKIKIIFYDQGNLDLDYLNKKKFITIIKKIEFYLRVYIFKSVWYTPLKSKHAKNTNKFFYVPFAIKYKNHKNLLSKNFNLLSIGKFQKRKNHLLLIKSFKKLLPNNSINLTIIGECSSVEHMHNYEIILKYIKKNDLTNKVKIILNIPHNKINEYYRKNNIFILASSNEPASISILEAMSFGLPVICSDTCGTKTYINHKRSGLIFKSNDIKSLSKSIEYLLNAGNFNEISKNSLKSSRISTSPNLFYENFKNMILKSFNIKEF